jgi:hypothetical protein
MQAAGQDGRPFGKLRTSVASGKHDACLERKHGAYYYESTS